MYVTFKPCTLPCINMQTWSFFNAPNCLALQISNENIEMHFWLQMGIYHAIMDF
jgi:hypothetical protein